MGIVVGGFTRVNGLYVWRPALLENGDDGDESYR